jgi:hypothetical protein
MTLATIRRQPKRPPPARRQAARAGGKLLTVRSENRSNGERVTFLFAWAP